MDVIDDDASFVVHWYCTLLSSADGRSIYGDLRREEREKGNGSHVFVNVYIGVKVERTQEISQREGRGTSSYRRHR